MCVRIQHRKINKVLYFYLWCPAIHFYLWYFAIQIQHNLTPLSWCYILSPRPSGQNKKCTCVNNRCIRSKISGNGLDCQRVELTANVTLAGRRWTTTYYITPVTGSSDQLERRCWNENHVPAVAGPPSPRLSSPRERERNAVVARWVGGGQYVAVLFSLQLTSHTQTFQ